MKKQKAEEQKQEESKKGNVTYKLKSGIKPAATRTKGELHLYQKTTTSMNTREKPEVTDRTRTRTRTRELIKTLPHNDDDDDEGGASGHEAMGSAPSILCSG